VLKAIPNILTVLRIVLALTGSWALWQSYFWSVDYNVPLWLGDASIAARTLAAYSVAAFVVAALSDWLDGFLARRWSAQSGFGALMDPIADKLLVDAYLLVYVLILDLGSDRGVSPYITVPVLAIVLRDVAITLVRMVSNRPGEEALPVSTSAKLKTLIAFVVTALPLAAFPLGLGGAGWLLDAWVTALWITAALSLATGLAYLRRKPQART
jgi:CDP-diacylglycerol--glycerol-3-phosphate 3-phosphatidyltransferase